LIKIKRENRTDGYRSAMAVTIQKPRARSQPACWLRIFLALALILAGGLHAGGAHAATAPEQLVSANSSDDHCGSGNADEPQAPAGCTSGFACNVVMLPVELHIGIAASVASMRQSGDLHFVGQDIGPRFPPPKRLAP
jgi:hypothetical protein